MTAADAEAILQLLQSRPGFQGVELSCNGMHVPAAALLLLGMRRLGSGGACSSLQHQCRAALVDTMQGYQGLMNQGTAGADLWSTLDQITADTTFLEQLCADQSV